MDGPTPSNAKLFDARRRHSSFFSVQNALPPMSAINPSMNSPISASGAGRRRLRRALISSRLRVGAHDFGLPRAASARAVARLFHECSSAIV